MPKSAAADRDASRFRLPVEPPVRELLIASLAVIAGGFQLAAWALANMPDFFLVLGTILVALAVGVAGYAFVNHLRLRWVIYVGPHSLAVVNGDRRRELAWSEIGDVDYDDFRLLVARLDGGHAWRLPVDRTAAAHDAAQHVLRVIRAQRPTPPT